MAEGHALRDAIHIRLVHLAGSAQVPPSFRAFALQQMAFARARAHHFAARGYLEPLGRGFLGLNAFWTSHIKVNRFASKKSGKYMGLPGDKQAVFWRFTIKITPITRFLLCRSISAIGSSVGLLMVFARYWVDRRREGGTRGEKSGSSFTAFRRGPTGGRELRLLLRKGVFF